MLQTVYNRVAVFIGSMDYRLTDYVICLLNCNFSVANLAKGIVLAIGKA